ncbi:zinc-ribbon domain-containing protein, partial [Pseudotabrizicola sp.]|uniref:zinc-ribbon domain-containing protein n=1 Tax=Pseudotabrizicola sp. TaxID=2939647 RepID=UPI0027231FF3
MRLICPNCDAQYEVDASAIPEAGRDVQCSNCGHAWFQIREVSAEDLSDHLYREPEPEQVAEVPAALAQTDAEDDTGEDEYEETAPAPPLTGPAPVQRVLDDSVLAILREEAEHEMAARRAEAVGVEMQGDLGLPPPMSPVVGSAAAAAAESSSARMETDKRIAAMQ